MKTRMFAIAGVAALALGFGMPAAAQTMINLAAVNQQTAAVSTDEVNQGAASVVVSVGSVTSSNIDSAASNLANTVLDDVDIDQDSSIVNGALVNQQSVVASLDEVNQGSLSVIGQGAVSGSNIDSSALNSANLATKTAVVVQK
jgi:hypothetical protein